MENNGIEKLSKMKRGQKGIVHSIDGGQNMVKKLEDIGIRVGKEILKVCNQPLSGPVQLRIGSIEIAIGHGMASKINVSVIDTIVCD